MVSKEIEIQVLSATLIGQDCHVVPDKWSPCSPDSSLEFPASGHLKDWIVIAKLDGKADSLPDNTLRAPVGICFRRIEVETDRYGVAELLFQRDQTSEVLYRFRRLGPKFHFDGYKVPLAPPPGQLSIEWDVNDQVRPDCDSVLGKGLLVLLLDDRIAWKIGLMESLFQFHDQFTLVSALRREKAGLANSAKRLLKNCQKLFH